MKEIICNIWDDYIEKRPTTLYVEENKIKDKEIILHKILPSVKKALILIGSKAQSSFRSNRSGKSGKFNTSLEFVRGTSYPFIRLENLKYNHCGQLPKVLNEMKLTHKSVPLHFISES
jgi:hypothetical protein